LEGGELSLAFTKKEKLDIVVEYESWLKDCQAVFVVAYDKMTMKAISALRAEARQTGSELHVVKNTLMDIAAKNAGLEPKGFFDGSSLVGFAHSDAASLAKALQKASKASEVFKIKGGYLDGKALEAAQVVALADLPPMPVMRAKLLGTISAPASKLVRTLAEPARQMAAVLKSYSEKPASVAG
jgi:large subunit ribosomal protein L10